METSTGGVAGVRWAQRQEGRGIPPEILAQAPANPWQHDPRHFAAPETPEDTPSRSAALTLLGGTGTVLDVGCGGGDAALALAGTPAAEGAPPPAVLTRAIGVDQQQDMLDLIAAAASARGIPCRTVRGRWPDAAAEAGRADVVVCHHVLHNVVDLPPFLRALSSAARRGVVVEMLPEHPMAWLDPLWLRFHGLRRPPSATADDAVAVLRELGFAPETTRWERTRRLPRDAEWVARRLCLSAGRVPEVAAALDEIPPRPPDAVTIVWRP